MAAAGFDSATPFRILTVCTMNICRSPALEVTLQDAAANCPGLSPGAVVVSSAGTHATPGAPSCDIAQAHVGRSSRDQTALQLTGEMLAAADLVITAERKHADAVASISTEFGRRCFPARVAQGLAITIHQCVQFVEAKRLIGAPAQRGTTCATRRQRRAQDLVDGVDCVREVLDGR